VRDCTLAVCVQSASVAFVIGILICARIDDQRQRYFVTGYRADRPASGITKASEDADIASVSAITERH
jgi:hypothetical protein